MKRYSRVNLEKFSDSISKGLREFGQEDYVRLYGKDYKERLEK